MSNVAELKKQLAELEEEGDEASAGTRETLQKKIRALQREEALSLASDLKAAATNRSASRDSLRRESPRETGATSPGRVGSPRQQLGSPGRQPVSPRPSGGGGGASDSNDSGAMAKRVLERHVTTLRKLFESGGSTSQKRQELELFSEAIASCKGDVSAYQRLRDEFYNKL